jgi:hypothetical protein
MSNNEQPAARSDRICYLHIGPHKTGTTSIQSALFANAARLASTLGVHYPTLPADKDPKRQRRSHTPLSRGSNFRFDSLEDAPHWQALSAKIPATGSIVLSSEHFAEILRHPDRYAKAMAFLRARGFRVVAIAYVRDQPAWLNSWYTQDQRNFMSQSTFEQFRDHALKVGLVDPNAFLKRFIDDPEVEVRVVAFERAIRQGLARSFFDVIGAPASFEVAEPRPSNPNIGIKGMYAAQEIMRRVDIRIRSLPNYSDLYESFRTLMQGRNWESESYVGVSPEDEAVIRARYAQSNDAFAQRWFGGDWATICPPRSLERRVFDFDGASDADKRDVTEVIDRMVGLIEGLPEAVAEFARERAKAGKKGLRAVGGKGPGGGQGKGLGKKLGKGLGKKKQGKKALRKAEKAEGGAKAGARDGLI